MLELRADDCIDYHQSSSVQSTAGRRLAFRCRLVFRFDTRCSRTFVAPCIAMVQDTACSLGDTLGYFESEDRSSRGLRDSSSWIYYIVVPRGSFFCPAVNRILNNYCRMKLTR
jgi:hypothetical protein